MQTMKTIKPRTAVEALRYARTAERAAQILKEGYTFEKDPDTEVIAVVKPGSTAAAYWINMLEPGCDCPDFLKHKDYCKHTIAHEMQETIDEAAAITSLFEQMEAEEDAAECAAGVDYLL